MAFYWGFAWNPHASPLPQGIVHNPCASPYTRGCTQPNTNLFLQGDTWNTCASLLLHRFAHNSHGSTFPRMVAWFPWKLLFRDMCMQLLCKPLPQGFVCNSPCKGNVHNTHQAPQEAQIMTDKVWQKEVVGGHAQPLRGCVMDANQSKKGHALGLHATPVKRGLHADLPKRGLNRGCTKLLWKGVVCNCFVIELLVTPCERGGCMEPPQTVH